MVHDNNQINKTLAGVGKFLSINTTKGVSQHDDSRVLLQGTLSLSSTGSCANRQRGCNSLAGSNRNEPH